MAKTNGFLAIFVCVSSLFLAGCGTLSTTHLSDSDYNTARQNRDLSLQQKVDNLCQPMVDNGQTPGVIVGVLLPDRTTHFFGYGVADEETGLKPNADTLFAIGSLSKGFLGEITSRLVDEGVLSWDDTLRTLLPPDTLLSPDAAKVTLLQLVTHTSGMPRQPLDLQTLSYFVEYLFNGENFYRHIDREYILNYLVDFEASHPGQPQYSNIGYGVLDYAITTHTGLSVDQLLEKQIVNPIGLKCTGYDPEILPCYSNRARGYAGDQPKFIARGNPTPDWSFTLPMRGAAAMYSNARDLMVYADAHIWDQKKRINATLANDLQVRFPQPERAAAIAWIVDNIEGEPIAYQIGFVGGYTSYIGVDVKHKTAVVIMQNSFNWDNSVGHKLLLGLRYGQSEVRDYSATN